MNIMIKVNKYDVWMKYPDGVSRVCCQVTSPNIAAAAAQFSNMEFLKDIDRIELIKERGEK